MRTPVSYDPPFEAWSLPNGSTLTPSIHHRAGQSTRHVSFPPPFMGTVPFPPQAHSYSTVSSVAEKPTTVLPVIRPHAGHRGLNGDQRGSASFPVSSRRMAAIRSRPCRALTMAGFILPLL